MFGLPPGGGSRFRRCLAGCSGAGKVTRGRLCGIIIEGLEEAAGMDADDFLAKAALTASSGPLQCRLCFSCFINLV